MLLKQARSSDVRRRATVVLLVAVCLMALASVAAVARGSWSGASQGIIVLDRSAKSALNAHGNGLMNVTGAPVIVNSSNSEAAIANGSNALLEAPGFDITGNYTTTGGGRFVGTMNT